MANAPTLKQKQALYRPRGLFDILKLPVVGRVLRWRYGRLVLQVPFLLIALLLIYDGLTGPQRAAENLATVIPWVHYRGVVVLALLLAGNLFCMGCPFTIPRTLAKRLSIRGRRFPRFLRNKWLAIVSLFMLFFLYEFLDMWSSPALTAWVIVAYFVASFALEAFFSESAFCKYVCPLGTFNFVYATASPTQITPRDADLCKSCVGKECINGSYAPAPVIRVDQIPIGGEVVAKTIEHGPKGTLGCGTDLFVPQIKSNLDCTLCLDCARACPHDNVALMVRTPGRELLQPEAWPKRWDISLLVVGMVALGLVNAFGMVPPVYDFMQNMANTLGLTAVGLSDSAIELIVLGLIFLVGGLLLPVALVVLAAQFTRQITGTQAKYSRRDTVAAFAPSFIPIGLGVWIAHYGFHFLIGIFTVIPAFQAFLIDHRITVLGSTPSWGLTGLDANAITLIQVVALLGGFLWSMVIAQRTALRLYRRQATVGLLAWAMLFLVITGIALWIFSQPMEMRGTILFG